jgi:hypothetical protein
MLSLIRSIPAIELKIDSTGHCCMKLTEVQVQKEPTMQVLEFCAHIAAKKLIGNSNSIKLHR